ncbi:hypothetical protein Godav_006082 [Gossypium davidsonii]|uniref:Uncharacterized protein n=1 Tax=Gossypium davidsonii TaxID=34287 RepID=A0A7J8S2T8_GOSDV|nr:hypothetical protein [Gossypium davidsonii]
MEKGFLDKVVDNAAVRTWSETTQREKGDSLAEGYVSELWDFTHISVTQNNLQELKKIWDQWNDETLKDLILAHPDTKKKVDVFALSIYGLVVFPNTLGHVDEAVTDLFDRLDKKLLLALFHSHFWKVDKVSYRVFSENYSPLKEIVAILRRDDISEEKWMEILQNLQEEDIEWRAP